MYKNNIKQMAVTPVVIYNLIEKFMMASKYYIIRIVNDIQTLKGPMI
jgi:hypothetical protein